ncbi:MAG: ABC transporter permease [Candidatus Cloacimonadaceae bacterium]|jgi:ABC-2 type transport system permease protein|nr:ABC transporter permease [Candidatus Cloacimonadota bacterium]MDY0126915.1 ABC transporter permease [Candidatus Cloacimonadaceae bacterium]MCB5255449.1 ABC transporter permease [Candidatus Cloacimonadota bacterium]MCK9178964.1 ABC transporter permease [Candidatus Cloacimonadota bacterium]MCK9242987.1 ABC transporter permease [Candidatus Cloacimonadota bacterium]
MPNLNRIKAISEKEVFHILRDSRTLAIIFILPLLQLIIFGYAMNMEIRQVPLVVDDHALNSSSRALVDAFIQTDYFRLVPKGPGVLDPGELFKQRVAQATLSIPKGFNQDDFTAQLKIDASDPNSAQMIQSYATGIVNTWSAKAGVGIALSPLILYNPDMKSSFFFVPGLIALILVMICALLTSISISREKEMGTMEQILVSPVTATEILLGKVLPYIFLGLMDALLILAVGMLLFQVPFRGEFAVFLGFTFLYVLTSLCLGLLVSTMAKTQQGAMMTALGMTLLPTLLLSGYMFPIPSMPPILRRITYIIPARYYLQIIRGIMLKGNSVQHLYQAGLSLVTMSVVMLVIAARRFKLRLS